VELTKEEIMTLLLLLKREEKEFGLTGAEISVLQKLKEEYER
jgi:hypothetical protein